MNKPTVSVIYLCYLPYGIDVFESFIKSYVLYYSGYEHQLVIVFKGNTKENEDQPYLSLLKLYNISFTELRYTGKGLDISTYHWASQQLDTDFIFCVNTRSRFLAKNWLYKFYTASQTFPTTVCSATGSLQSHVSSAFMYHKKWYDTSISAIQNLKRYFTLIMASSVWWKAFPLFPNPHIRTNAFFINRMLFLSLNIGSITTKGAAYRFESGRRGMSAQLKKKGFQLAILGKDGRVFTEANWPDSNICNIGDQENLLIADNQTDYFNEASPDVKTMITKISWKR